MLKNFTEAPAEFQKLKCKRPYFMYVAKIGAVPMPCGKCLYCRKQKANEWKNRLIDEFRVWNDVSFLTLTYKEVSWADDAELFRKSRDLDYTDIQAFMKRLRQYLWRNHQIKNIKFFCAGEYGERFTKRAHWHLILFGVPNTDKIKGNIKRMWGFEGETKNLDMQTCYDEKGVSSYVSQYVVKKLDIESENEAEKEKRKPPFQHCSKGIGLAYALKNYLKPAYESFKAFGNIGQVIHEGKRVYFCRYIKNKILSILEESHEGITEILKEYGLRKMNEYWLETKAIFNTFWNGELPKKLYYNKYNMFRKHRSNETDNWDLIKNWKEINCKIAPLDFNWEYAMAWQFRHLNKLKTHERLHHLYKIGKMAKAVI